VKLILRPKSTSFDAADSSGFGPQPYRANSLQYWGAAQDVWALLRSDDWCALHSRNKQLVFFDEFVQTEYSRSRTSEVLGQAFGIEPSHVRKISSKTEKKPKPPDRPAALNEDQTAVVADFTENGHHTRNYVTQRDIHSFIEINFQKCLSYQSMASFLKKHANLICRSVFHPQENVRLEVPHEYLDQDVTSKTAVNL
jgi:hypothetical protein